MQFWRLLSSYFAWGAFFNNAPSHNVPRIGKRQIDLIGLQNTYQHIMQNNPGLDGQKLQAHLVNEQLKMLKVYTHIESMGIKPSPEYLKTTIHQQLPQDTTLSEFSKQVGQPPQQLLQTIQDRMSEQLLISAIQNSAIVTQDMKGLTSTYAGTSKTLYCH